MSSYRGHQEVYGDEDIDYTYDYSGNSAQASMNAVFTPIKFISGGIAPSKLSTEPIEETSKDNSVGSSNSTANPIVPRSKPKLDKDFAKFVKTGSGFGLRMLQKMGFKGGLGRNDEGVVGPIEVQVRPRNAGIGSIKEIKNPELNPVLRAKQEAEEAAAEEAKRGRKKSVRVNTNADAWRSSVEKQQTKVKTIAQIREELISKVGLDEAARLVGSGVAEQVVYDMRGPDVKVVAVGEHDVISLDQATLLDKDAMHLREFQYNVQHVITLTEQDLIRCDRELSSEKKRLSSLEDQLLRLDIKAEAEANDVEDATNFNNFIITQFASLEGNVNVTTEAALLSLSSIFTAALKDYPSMFMKSSMHNLLESVVFRLFSLFCQSWSIIDKSQNSKLINILSHWRMTLAPPQSSAQRSRPQSSQDPQALLRSRGVFDLMLRETVVPHIAHQLTNWSPVNSQQTSSVANLFIDLQRVCTATSFSMLSSALVTRLEGWVLSSKDQSAADIAQAILPFMPPVANIINLEDCVTLNERLRQRLTFAMSSIQITENWNSCKTVLEYWIPSQTKSHTHATVFNESQSDSFLARSIVPTLARLMHEVPILPQAQPLSLFNSIMKWSEFVRPERIVKQVLLPHFFITFFRVLQSGLTARRFVSCTEWLGKWRQVLPHNVIENTTTHNLFILSLSLINLTFHSRPTGDVMGEIQTLLQNSQVSTLSQTQRSKLNFELPHEFSRQSANTQSAAGDMSESMSFRAIVERVAEHHQIMFRPHTSKTSPDGTPVYLFGSSLIYLAGNDILCQQNGLWSPVSLPALVTKSRLE